MKALAVVLAGGIALAFVRETWAWRLEQILLLAIGAWGAASGRLRYSAPLAILLALAGWPLLQVALRRSAYEWAATNTVLLWLAWLVAFAVAASLAQDEHIEWIAGFGAAIAFIALMQRHTAVDGKIYWLFDSGYRQGLMGPLVRFDVRKPHRMK